MAIQLADDEKKQATVSIRRYFAEQLDQDVGDLKAQLLLDFFLKEIGPCIHNAALNRAEAYLRDRVADMEGACSEIAFTYWPKQTMRKP